MRDTDSETIDGKPVSEKHIYKEPILCHLVIQCTRNDGSRFVSSIPLVTGWEEDCYATDLDDNDVVVGVVPMMPGSYRVSGVDVDHNYVALGSEYVAVDHPSWVDELLKHRQYQLEFGSAVGDMPE